MTFITPDEFDLLSDFIYRKTGIRFESKKLYFLSKRIQKRMDALGIETVSAYIRKLRFADPDRTEFQQLIELLTINETYFFRDFPQYQAFAEECLPEVEKRKSARGDFKLRLWSAGCSSGEEPYTIAIILREMLDNFRNWEIEIIASDINRNVLKIAEEGRYTFRSIRDVPPEYLERYFARTPRGDYTVSEKLKEMIRFEQVNLAEKESVRKKRGFDFIFCRNLLIYFDDVSTRQLVNAFYVALNPEGFIFLGSSESIGRITTAFQMRRMGGFLVYQK